MHWNARLNPTTTSRAQSWNFVRRITLCALALLPTMLMSGAAHAVDPPTNIRIEQNVLLWDDVPGANKYNIYYFTHPSAEDTGNSIQYRATVDGRNEYLPTEAGFYTVVTVGSNSQGGTAFSDLTNSTVVEFNIGGNQADAVTGDQLFLIRTLRCNNTVTGSSCIAQCPTPRIYNATGGACRADTGTVLHQRARQSGFECIAQNDTSFVEVDVYCQSLF